MRRSISLDYQDANGFIYVSYTCTFIILSGFSLVFHLLVYFRIGSFFFSFLFALQQFFQRKVKVIKCSLLLILRIKLCLIKTRICIGYSSNFCGIVTFLMRVEIIILIDLELYRCRCLAVAESLMSSQLQQQNPHNGPVHLHVHSCSTLIPRISVIFVEKSTQLKRIQLGTLAVVTVCP